MNNRLVPRLVLGLAVAGLGSFFISSTTSAADGPDAKDVKASVDKAVAYLKSKQDPKDGSWSADRAGPGVTALVVVGLLRSGVPADDPAVAKGLAFLEKNIKKDGGVYDKGLANYTTSVALLAFKEANQDGKYNQALKDGAAFLKTMQYPADSKKPVKEGGAGYDAPGKSTRADRPDLSNTQFLIDAMAEAGIPNTDPAIQKALKFVGRCQNEAGKEANDQPFALKASEDDKGGFTYIPDPDESHHKADGGGLRSLGAMTYAGLKSFLYAGVGKDDVRVKAALGWIRRHYTLAENPGEGQAGLYYYYHTFAKAMAALGEDQFEDAKGTKHDWRKELAETLIKKQKGDGSWVNPGDRTFGEGDPNIATAFALLSMSYTKPAK